ncbi:MAG TPA: hypothetical protein VLL49_08595 [Anaerolineales bacterium]|nr:hypothetical protein [Anaerolineales bacterium]
MMQHELKKIAETVDADWFKADPDILVVIIAPGAEDSLEAARRNSQLQQAHARQMGRRCGLVVVMNRMRSHQVEARGVYAESLLPEIFFGLALVVDNPLARAIGSFYTGLSKPAIPVRLVATIEDGIAWLERIRGK